MIVDFEHKQVKENNEISIKIINSVISPEMEMSALLNAVIFMCAKSWDIKVGDAARLISLQIANQAEKLDLYEAERGVIQ
ncbi:hypothetical protein [Veillonella sp.]|uniref:hypothetical protein n=1 Tax=Veillonella sp. TaxID=1926307 RepID=UPI0025EB10A9|nr:hypothetical protein [Veillonella sp.]